MGAFDDLIPGYFQPDLAEGRTRFSKELDDPGIQSAFNQRIANEVGGQTPEEQQAFIESVLNRANARKQNLSDVVNDRSYFPSQSFRDAGDVDFSPLISKALLGSNVSKRATGNESGNVHSGGAPVTMAGRGGERFVVENPDMASVFADLIPGKQSAGGAFDDLIPQKDTIPTYAPQVVTPPDEQAAPTADEEHDLLYYKTGKTKSEREALNAPLREAMQVPLVSPETIGKGLQAVSEIGATRPEDLQQGPVEKSIQDEIAKAISGMTTGEGVASLPLYAFPPTAAALTAENVQQLPGQIDEAVTQAKAGDYPGAASAGTKAVLNALMTLGVLHGGAELMSPREAPLAAEIKAMPEPPPTVSRGPGTIAQDVSRALERRFTLQPEPPPDIAPSEPIEQTLSQIPQVPQEQPFFNPELGPSTRQDFQMPLKTETAQLSPADRNGQILERRQGILDRKAELEARAANGEPVEAQLAAVQADLLDPSNPVVHAPPKTASNVPDWLRQQQEQLAAIAEKSGVADKIEELHAQRLTAGQIATQLGIEADMVRAVREGRGLPARTDEMQGAMMGGGGAAATENPAFTKWVNERGQSPPPPGAVAAPPEPYTPEAAAARAAQPQPVIPPEDVKYAGGGPQTEVPGTVGISQARTEAELGPGSVVPGVGAEMGSGLAHGRDYINKGGDPRLPIRRANTSGMVGKNDVGIVHAELDRLRVERSKAAAALEANPADPVLQQNFSVADDAQRAWRKELQPVLTKASDALREAHAASMPDADVGTYQGLADLMDEHFKGERVVTPEMRTAMAKAARGVKETRDIANGEIAKVEGTLEKQVRARGKKVMSPEELEASIRNRLETEFADCVLGA